MRLRPRPEWNAAGPVEYSCGFGTSARLRYVSQHGGAIESVIYGYISLDRWFEL